MSGVQATLKGERKKDLHRLHRLQQVEDNLYTKRLRKRLAVQKRQLGTLDAVVQNVIQDML